MTADGRFLLAIYKDNPVNRMELYLSTSTHLDDQVVFPVHDDARQLDSGLTFLSDGTPDAILENWPADQDWQTMNFVTDCSGSLFILGMNGNDDGTENHVDNYRLTMRKSDGVSLCHRGAPRA